MLRRNSGIALLACMVAAGSVSISRAESPWKKLIPFRRVEADAKKSYWLTDQQGPWMVLASSFAGEGATEQAHRLVLEIRSRYRLPAYMHKRHFDFTRPEVGRGLNRYGEPRMMRRLHGTEFDEIAVLVGNYPSADAPAIAEDLETIKTAKPACLTTNGQQTTQRFAALREFQRMVHLDPEVRSKGPMRRAMVVRNPLLPKEYFVNQGIDPLVLKMNRGVRWSLLDNPGKYTVRVASFKGESRFVGEEEAAASESSNGLFSLISRSKPSKLEQAAEDAHRLTEALRNRGIPAWEFHDRFESIVTVGTFESVGEKLPNGSINLDPGIYRIMQTYGADKTSIPGNAQAFKPRSLDGIKFDVQPMPVRVPKRSIGDSYAGSPIP